MFTAQRPTRKVNTQLSRSLRQERTKLGLSTAPQSPPPIHINPKIPQPFELDQTINTNSTSKQSLPESLPELNPTSTILSEIRERTPALLKVPTINDKLGLNLLRLAESNSINNVQDTWSLQSVRSTQSNTNYTNYNNNHNNYNNDTEVISKVEPYFAKDGDVEHARHVGKEVLDTLRAVLDQYKYKPNNNIETPPPGQVTRTCFDALKTLQDTMTGPVQSLLSQAFAILEHAAYVNPTFIKERLIPLNVIPPIKPSSIPTMTPSTPTSTPTPTPTTIPSLLHTEAVILLQQATFTATQQLNQWQQQEKNSKIKLNTIQTELEQLTKNETSMRLQLTALLRKEGSTTNERNGLVQKEKKLLTELKHARMASHEAEKEEQILKTKRNFLEDEYTNVREELQYEEDKLRRTQMTIDTNVVPRTEVMEVRSQIVTMKATLNEYKVVHERLKARSMKEHDVHCAIQSDLKVAIQERRALEEEHKELQRTHTPRPEWDHIMDLCPELRRKVHERVFDAISNHHNTTAKKQNTLDSNGTTNAATDNTTDNSDNSDKSDNNNNNSSISTDLNTTSEKASTTTTTLKPTAMYSTARSKPRQSMVTPSGLSIGKTHGSSAFTSLVVTAKKHDDTILQSIVQQSNSNATQSNSNATQSTQSTSSALQSDWRPKIHDATELLTLDLIALIETNRTKNIELLELEGTLRELGVVELKKICQDTKRHIIETERMIDDVRKTQEKVATSSTHKALVGGDKHTILEGQFFQGVGNHPQVPRFLRWSGKVRKRGIQKGELWSLTDRVWKARIKQRKKYDEYLKSLSDENNNGSTTSTSKKKPMNSFGRIKKKTKPPIKPEESFAEFFYNWLFHRHKSHQLVVEWGYNVMAGLEIYMWDAHLELFLLCLTGAVTEDTFDDQLILLDDMRNFFIRIDLADAKKKQLWHPTGIIQYEDAVASLRFFFPEKAIPYWKAICEKLKENVIKRGGDGPLSEPIEYEKLFAVSNLGTQGDFLEEVRDQHLREVRQASITLEVEVAKIVGEHTKDAASGGKSGTSVSGGHHGEIMVMKLREILAEIDPHAPSATLDSYLSIGLGVSEKNVKWDQFVDPDLFLRKLKKRLYRPYRTWVQNAKVKLVHFIKVREEGNKSERF